MRNNNFTDGKTDLLRMLNRFAGNVVLLHYLAKIISCDIEYFRKLSTIAKFYCRHISNVCSLLVHIITERYAALAKLFFPVCVPIVSLVNTTDTSMSDINATEIKKISREIYRSGFHRVRVTPEYAHAFIRARLYRPARFAAAGFAPRISPSRFPAAGFLAGPGIQRVSEA